MTKPRKHNPAWKDNTRTERSKAFRERKKAQLAELNAKLSPLGLDHDTLVQGVIDGSVIITTK